jgi:hypothetical protein
MFYFIIFGNQNKNPCKTIRNVEHFSSPTFTLLVVCNKKPVSFHWNDLKFNFEQRRRSYKTY